ncbi:MULTISPECIES: amidase family protein [unclassified Mesorhizobium]|uniref:amidase family protein n=1 Tax=unclassified Mesorhizobium TaxID=325217 RepID=UPI000FD5DAD0|nr:MULTISPECIES: amidase family protein [unclassified Mesorhizobium]RUU73695.1 amidase [Mesorhizobium sp. M7A.F.Ca.MR.362.00.0.0]RWN86221.1 MAG: amidase [Mesorhizobium sp.]RWO93319.1 MAG: amidase [Mesorhizobium sp.]TIM49775.1 MAG: amidase [Mesorhizobium sp.]
MVQPKRPYVEELSQRNGILRVGVARTKWGAVDVDPEVLEAVESTATLLEEMGHIVTDIESPYEPSDYVKIWLGLSSYSARSLEEAARSMGRAINADTLEPANLKVYEYGRNLQRQEADLHETLQRMRFSVGESIESFDILLTPTMPCGAIPHGATCSATNPTVSAEEFTAADAALCQYTGVFNVTGQPAVSLPLAQSASGLPIGLQIVGRFGDEATLVRIARDLEEAMPWSHRLPKVRAGG